MGHWVVLSLSWCKWSGTFLASRFYISNYLPIYENIESSSPLECTITILQYIFCTFVKKKNCLSQKKLLQYCYAASCLLGKEKARETCTKYWIFLFTKTTTRVPTKEADVFGVSCFSKTIVMKSNKGRWLTYGFIRFPLWQKGLMGFN